MCLEFKQDNMMPQNPKMLIGAVIAAALAFAVYYGLIGQQAANTIQGQANQTLGAAPASQQSASPTLQNPATQTSAPTAPVPQGTAPAPH